MTLINLINMKPVVEHLLDIDSMPFALAYRLTSVIDILNTNTEFYLSKMRQLIDKYGQKDKNGEFIQNENGDIPLIPETAEEFNAKVSELESIEITEELPKFTLDEFSSVQLSPRQVYLIRPLITE